MTTSPCNRRTTLFEPYRLQGETDDQRSRRLSLALSVCERCPLRLKDECLDRALEDNFARGVWGGTIITRLDKREEMK